ncbi:MAG: SNF2-related protein [Steroidobacteraceae bacterium]
MRDPAIDPLAQLQDVFGELLYRSAERLIEIGCVLDVRILQAGSVVTGIVAADADRRTGNYRVYIRYHTGRRSCGAPNTKASQNPPRQDSNGRTMEGDCSCGELSPCVHVAAVSITAEKQALAAIPAPRRSAVEPSLQLSAAAPTRSSPQQQRLYYVLEKSRLETAGRRAARGIQISAWVGQTMWGSESIRIDSLHTFAARSSPGSGDFPRYVDPRDKEILKALNARQLEGPWEINGDAAGDLLGQIVATGRAFWQSMRGRALRASQPRQAQSAWEALPNGDQELRCQAGPADVFPDIEPAMYIDSTTLEAGPLELPCSVSLLRHYWHHAAIPPEQVAAANEQISRDAGTEPFPRLQVLSVQAQALSTLEARLVLSAGPAALLYFVYNGLPVDSSRLQPNQDRVRQMVAGTLYEIDRDGAVEQQLRTQLERILPAVTDSRKQWFTFMMEALPRLQAAGWEICVASSFPYRIAKPDNWYGDLETDRQQGWFNLRLGVLVDGRQVNLLPALARYLQTSLAGDAVAEGKALAPDDSGFRVGEQWLVLLDDGRYLPIAIDRIQRIANTLVELFDRNSLTRHEALSLPTSQSGRLAQLSRELNGPVLRSDDSSLRALIEDLEASGGIQPMAAPAPFQAVLRPYQEEGLGWLQFLRRHRLGGILADDMGLGKTVQTLAHLTLEKQHGRLHKPSLIVAPVSTLGNWQQEIQRFVPELQCLTLHGSRRRESFPLIDKVDVVITGYPLLQLDSDILLAREFYLVILDEAQTIKNPRAKVSQAARALRADYRLCLTGTPIENHLGELWSLFDFVQPGLLGDERHFQRHYRTPIEKNGNRPRAQALAQRLAPFLLRRTKDAVAKDLPPKTEIVEAIALDDKQRDFYDGIRLATHRRIQEVVKQQGLARSQITILDALLKLRQACCDPRLLGVATAGEDIPSAKLDWLTTALPELIAEGRRVLLFSQFTSMLRLIEAAVIELSIPYCQLTGETQNRPDVIARFQSGAAPLFLISLKAGGTGLNLTAADTVIHYDPWWNPAVEAQATDRAHRIGQDKPVFVYKLIAQGTVEEKIMQLQAAKYALANRLYTQGNASPASWTASDLEALFAP